MSQPRLLLADDHLEIAAVLRDLLRPEFDVIAQVQDGYALLSAVERLSPDVIVSDISMPGLDGITAAAQIVFVTGICDPLLMERGFEAGALGYVMKCEASDELLPAVRSALRGERHVS